MIHLSRLQNWRLSTHLHSISSKCYAENNSELGHMSGNFKQAEEAVGAGDVPFYPYTERIFWNVFDFFGTLDGDGRVITLNGSIFEQTKTDPTLLVGQRLSETVF